MYERITDKNWRKNTMISEETKRLAELEDGIENGEIMYVTDGIKLIKTRIARLVKRQLACSEEMDFLQEVLRELGQ